MNRPFLPPFAAAAEPLSPLVAETVDIRWLGARAGAWDRLLGEAVSPNPYYGRRVVTAHVDHGVAAHDLRFLVARRGERLLGLLPFRPRGARVGWLRTANTAWTSPYVVTTTPLVATEEAAGTVAVLLDAMGREACPLWRWPALPLDGAFPALAAAGLDARGWAREVVASFQRPILERRASYEAYARTCLSRHRRAGLRRTARRLAEAVGPVEHVGHEGGRDLHHAVEEFLRLELTGWKGGRGTALASHAATAAFARALFGADGGGGPIRPRADVLRAGDRVVAVSLSLVHRGTAHLLKTAFDEDLARFGPGVLLEDAIVRACHPDGGAFAARLDSATQEGGGGLLAEIYPDRERVGDWLLAPSALLSAGGLARLARQDALACGIAGRAKGLYWALSERRFARFLRARRG